MGVGDTCGFRRAVRPARAALAAAALGLAACAAPRAPGPPPVTLAPAPPASPYPDLDRYVLSAPPDVEADVGALAAYLAAGAKDERQRAWAIFRWVAENIRYDATGFFSGSYGELSPGEVLRRRVAVCDGYAGLFESLAAAAGLEARHVIGCAKGAGYEVGRPFGALPNHAWNAVRIGGRWGLVDCTWASGSLDEQNRYEHVFEPYYFLPPPEQFVLTHLPTDPGWQLLPQPVTMEEFVGSPYVKTAFFTCGLRLLDQKAAVITARGPLVEVDLEAPFSTDVIAKLVLEDRPLAADRVRVVRDGARARIFALLPNAGDYVLRVFATRGPAGGVHDWALDYAVRAESGIASMAVETYLERKGIPLR